MRYTGHVAVHYRIPLRTFNAEQSQLRLQSIVDSSVVNAAALAEMSAELHEDPELRRLLDQHLVDGALSVFHKLAKMPDRKLATATLRPPAPRRLPASALASRASLCPTTQDRPPLAALLAGGSRQMMAAEAMAWFWRVWLATIVFVFPIPHTIALRNLLLLVGVLLLLATLRQAPRPRFPQALKAAAWALVATTAWLVLHSLTVAPAPTLALDNLRGDWIVPLLTGVLAAYAAARAGPRQALLAVIAALLAHMIWMLSWQLWIWVAAGASGPWPAGITPFGERDYQSTLNGFLFAILLAERFAVLSIGGSVALLPSRLAWTLLAVSLIADIALRTRNGTIVGIALLLTTIVWMARRRPRFLLLLLVVAALGSASFALDSRWSGLKESIAVGWNSPKSVLAQQRPGHSPADTVGSHARGVCLRRVPPGRARPCWPLASSRWDWVSAATASVARSPKNTATRAWSAATAAGWILRSVPVCPVSPCCSSPPGWRFAAAGGNSARMVTRPA